MMPTIRFSLAFLLVSLALGCQGDPIVVERSPPDTGAMDSASVDGALRDTAADLAESTCSLHTFVQNGECVACPAGSSNDEGDEPAGANTTCDPILCGENEYVQTHECVACVAPSTNPAGDDASGADTSCHSFCEGRVVLAETLETSSGTVRGGRFDGEGWTTQDTRDQIAWDLGTPIHAGSITFEVRGLSRETMGCYPGWGVCYFASLYEEASGDKAVGAVGSAFIEARYHNQNGVNYRDIFKLQSGLGDGGIHEVITGEIGWRIDEWHTIRVEWGSGEARFLMDGRQVLRSPYGTTRTVDWRYLFLGSNNFKREFWAPVGVSFRNLCITQD